MVGRGDRVRVLRGKSRGAVGVVFWAGEAKWGPRVGIETADGEKVWAKPTEVELETPVAAPLPGGLTALAAAFDSPAVAGAIAATAAATTAAMVGADEILALTARVAGLELLVAKLAATVAALEGAAPVAEPVRTVPVSPADVDAAAEWDIDARMAEAAA